MAALKIRVKKYFFIVLLFGCVGACKCVCEVSAIKCDCMLNNFMSAREIGIRFLATFVEILKFQFILAIEKKGLVKDCSYYERTLLG